MVPNTILYGLFTGGVGCRAVVRFGSSLLGKLVDSLAPSITAILVRGKQVTIGVFGYDEEVIDNPLPPRDIKNILYNRCSGYDVTQAVLQQELIINIAKFLSTEPHLFSGILKIRIGSVRASFTEDVYVIVQCSVHYYVIDSQIHEYAPFNTRDRILRYLVYVTLTEDQYNHRNIQ